MALWAHHNSPPTNARPWLTHGGCATRVAARRSQAPAHNRRQPVPVVRHPLKALPSQGAHRTTAGDAACASRSDHTHMMWLPHAAMLTSSGRTQWAAVCAAAAAPVVVVVMAAHTSAGTVCLAVLARAASPQGRCAARTTSPTTPRRRQHNGCCVCETPVVTPFVPGAATEGPRLLCPVSKIGSVKRTYHSIAATIL